MDLNKVIRRFSAEELVHEYYTGLGSVFKEYKEAPVELWMPSPVVKKEVDRGPEWAKRTLTRWSRDKK